MLRKAYLAALITLAPLGVLSSAQTPDANAPGLQAETTWLQLVDAAKYEGAWNSAAPLMRNAISEPAFAQSVTSARAPLGALSSRKLVHAEARTSLPGAPDGHYLIAQFAAVFANKADAVETVTAAQQPDGTWHVAGYFIR